MQYAGSNGEATGGTQISPASHVPGEGSVTAQRRARAPQVASGMVAVWEGRHEPGTGVGALTSMREPIHIGPKLRQLSVDASTVAHTLSGVHEPP